MKRSLFRLLIPLICLLLATWDVLAAPPASAPWLQRAVEAFEKQLGIEQQAPAEAGDDGAAGKLALARAIGLREEPGTPEAAGMQRIVAAPLEAQQQRRWGALHVEARVDQVEEIEQQVAAALNEVQTSLDELQQSLAQRLWLPPTLCRHALARHAAAQTLLRGFLRRLEAVRAGFGDLPVAAAE